MASDASRQGITAMILTYVFFDKLVQHEEG